MEFMNFSIDSLHAYEILPEDSYNIKNRRNSMNISYNNFLSYFLQSYVYFINSVLSTNSNDDKTLYKLDEEILKFFEFFYKFFKDNKIIVKNILLSNDRKDEFNLLLSMNKKVTSYYSKCVEMDRKIKENHILANNSCGFKKMIYQKLNFYFWNVIDLVLFESYNNIKIVREIKLPGMFHPWDLVKFNNLYFLIDSSSDFNLKVYDKTFRLIRKVKANKPTKIELSHHQGCLIITSTYEPYVSLLRLNNLEFETFKTFKPFAAINKVKDKFWWCSNRGELYMSDNLISNIQYVCKLPLTFVDYSCVVDNSKIVYNSHICNYIVIFDVVKKEFSTLEIPSCYLINSLSYLENSFYIADKQKGRINKFNKKWNLIYEEGFLSKYEFGLYDVVRIIPIKGEKNVFLYVLNWLKNSIALFREN